MQSTQYTDVKIKTAIATAKPSSDDKWLAPGQYAYMQLKTDEQHLVNNGIRQLSSRIPNVGPISALEILAAIGATWEKRVPLEPES